MIGHLTRRATERSHHRVCRPPHVSHDHTQDVCEHSTCAPYARLEPADTFKPAFDGCGLKTAGICTIRHSRVHVRLCAGCDRHAGAPGSDPTPGGARAPRVCSRHSSSHSRRSDHDHPKHPVICASSGPLLRSRGRARAHGPMPCPGARDVGPRLGRSLGVTLAELCQPGERDGGTY